MGLETHSFDDRYIAALRDRDPETEAHFIAHFKTPLWLKARRHLRAPDLAEDACQETLLRVLRHFRSGKGLNKPESLPAFVHSVCHKVALETIRSGSRYRQMAESAQDPVDTRVDLHLNVVTDERRELIEQALSQLSDKDSELLRLAMLEEVDRGELCKRLNVTEDYLRVVLFRARNRFRDALLKCQSGARHKKLGAG